MGVNAHASSYLLLPPACSEKGQRGEEDDGHYALPERQSRDRSETEAVQGSGQEYQTPGDHRDHDHTKRQTDGHRRGHQQK